MEKILSSTKQIMEESIYVSIDNNAILNFTKSITRDSFEDSFSAFFVLERYRSEDDILLFSFITNAINFSYWGDPKWTVNVDGNSCDGSIGLSYAFKKAVNENINILDSKYLENISNDDMRDVLRGNIEIPLLEKRTELLNEVGKVLNDKYDGKVSNILKSGNHKATDILNILTTDFLKCFDDKLIYNGQCVYFDKKAQLFIYELYKLSKSKIISTQITGCETLTSFADYKVPQMLRKLGILVYSQELSDIVDNKVEINSGDRKEIEIRANTIWAIELMRLKLSETFDNINASDVDFLLWKMGQNKSPDDKPYHRTRTVWY